MLALSRKKGEEIVITVPPSSKEQRIIVALIDPGYTKCRIGIHADPVVKINRREVQDDIDAGISLESKKTWECVKRSKPLEEIG